MTRTRSLVRVAGAALAATAVGVGLLGIAPAYGGLSIQQLDAKVTPDPSTPGEPLTIAPASPDDLCPNGTTLEWFIDGETVDFSTDGSEDLDETGEWTVHTTAPTEPDTYDFEASCLGVLAVNPTADAAPAGGQPIFAEYAVTFTVGQELDPFQASLDKASGAPGEDIQLGGIACFGDSGAALFMPPGAVPEFSQDLVDDGLQQYEVADNQFGGVVPVPDDTAPGTYQVVAWCLDGGELAADPVVLAYTVLAPGAVPVPAAPEFTG